MPKVGIQGESGSFSEEAALKLLGGSAEIRGFKDFEQVFSETRLGKVDVCVVPLENSLTGSIHRNYDLLRKCDLKINRELYLRIQHFLITSPGVGFDQIDTVISHPVALDQCQHFLEKHQHLEIKTSHDTSGSVREMLEGQHRNWGAIAGRRAAETFGGQIVLASIEDNKENYTRFVLLSPSAGEVEDADKTSILFSFNNTPGALFKSLSVFALREIDLAKIESRPIHGRPWEYLFYLDFLGSTTETRVKNALNHLKEMTETLEVLGCYRRDKTVDKKGM
jgi:prephenate dehydratase